MHDRVVNGQPQQDRRKAHTHHVDASEDQPAQGQRAAENECQQRQQPEHGFQAAVRQPEQNGNNERGAADRDSNVALHSVGDFSHKGRTSGVSGRNSGRQANLFDFFEPLIALAIGGQIARGFDVEHPELAIG